MIPEPTLAAPLSTSEVAPTMASPTMASPAMGSHRVRPLLLQSQARRPSAPSPLRLITTQERSLSSAPHPAAPHPAAPYTAQLSAAQLSAAQLSAAQLSAARHIDGTPNEWPSGRLLELASSDAASARTTTAIEQVARLQRQGELVAWVQLRGGTFYPPDAAEAGVDLATLTVVHVPSSALEAARATELLLRSGAFALVIVDLEGMVDASLPSRALARLHALCRQHDSTVAFLTPPTQEALGSLVSLRLEPRRHELRAPLEPPLPHAPETAPEADASVRAMAKRARDEETHPARIEETLHTISPEILRDKLGHAPMPSLHRGPLGLSRHDELKPTHRGAVVPFPARSAARAHRDESTLPLPFFEAQGA